MSLASRRRMMLKGGTKEAEPEVDWSMSVLKKDDTIPFPYSERPYAFHWRQGNVIKSSDHPFYILKTTWRDYKLFTTDPKAIGIKNFNVVSVDTSDLGDGEYYCWTTTSDFGNFGGCNYPVLEVRYSDDRTKLYVVRE